MRGIAKLYSLCKQWFLLLLVLGVAFVVVVRHRQNNRLRLGHDLYWEYRGNNSSCIVSSGVVLVGPGGIELEEFASVFVGQCYHEDACRSTWFLVYKGSNKIVSGNSFEKLRREMPLRLQKYFSMWDPHQMETFHTRRNRLRVKDSDA